MYVQRVVPLMSVGMLVNMRFAEHYEDARSYGELDIFRGFVENRSMGWSVRRPIVYRDSIIELRYGFRMDGVYIVFRVGDFLKEWFLRKWSDEEVSCLMRPDLAYQSIECVPGPFVGELL
jgi:hypothetical protein